MFGEASSTHPNPSLEGEELGRRNSTHPNPSLKREGLNNVREELNSPQPFS
jgi:hypothetical protein